MIIMELGTRERLITLLKDRPNLTPAEMAAELNITQADVRYHLKALLARGTVVKMPVKQHTLLRAAGRPAKAYQLSTQARPDILADLASTLMEVGQAYLPADRFLESVADKLVPVEASQPPQASIAQKLNAAVQIMNQRPYQARWEAHSTGPGIIFHNCPFSQVIHQHPELCQVDRLVLQKLTGLTATQQSKIDFAGPTSSVCVFSLHPPSKFGK